MFQFFFFFQAEDGIRDATVTGVQTCALPICAAVTPAIMWGIAHAQGIKLPTKDYWQFRDMITVSPRRRSEERRVGKERISRASAYHLKKKPLVTFNSGYDHIAMSELDSSNS